MVTTCPAWEALPAWDALSELTGTEPPAALSALRDAEERFDDVVSVSNMNRYVEDSAVRILA